MALKGNFQAKTRLENGVRVDTATGRPYSQFSFTPDQSQALSTALSGLKQSLAGLQQRYGQFRIPDLSAISSDNLSGQKPLVLPSTQPSNALNQLSSLTQTGAYQPLKPPSITDELSANKTQQEADLASERRSLYGTMKDILGMGDKRTALEEKLVTPAQQADREARVKENQAIQAVNDINEKLSLEDINLEKRIEQIQKNPEGKFGGALQQDINQAQRESLSRKADLSLLKLSASRDLQSAQFGRELAQYDLASAQALVKSKIDAEMEPLKQLFEFQKFFYEENKSELDKTTQNLLNQKIRDNERLYDEGKDAKERGYKLLLESAQNGAPTQVQQQILAALNGNDFDTVFGLAGPYLAKSSIKLTGDYGDGLYNQLKTRSVDFNSLPADQKKMALSIFAQRGETIPRPLTAKEKDAADNATSGLDAVQQLQQLATAGKLPLFRSYIFGDTAAGRLAGTSQFTNLIKEATDIKTRIRTGAALNTQEISFYASQAPSFGDSPGDVQRKLSQLEGFYLGMSGIPVQITSPDGKQTFEFQDLFNAQQRLGLRQAIAGGWTLSY